MKKLILKILKKIRKLFFNFFISIDSFLFLIRFKNSKLVIFDIDNTLCDTWPLFKNKELSNKNRWKQAKPFQSMIELVSTYKTKEFIIVYLSARPLNSKKLTRTWLKSYGLPNKNIYTSITAENKMLYLKKLNQKFDYYDDLTHGTEHGEIKYYNKVMDFVKAKPNINYYDYSQIRKIQKGDYK